ncbi:unnamed protein product [Cunninghamella echinulata]
MLSRLSKINRKSIPLRYVKSTSNSTLVQLRLSSQKRLFTSEKDGKKLENSNNNNDNKPFNIPKGFEGFFGKDAGKSTKQSNEAKKSSMKVQ